MSRNDEVKLLESDTKPFSVLVRVTEKKRIQQSKDLTTKHVSWYIIVRIRENTYTKPRVCKKNRQPSVTEIRREE